MDSEACWVVSFVDSWFRCLRLTARSRSQLNALRTGMDVAEDVLGSGRGLKESVKRRIPEGIKRTARGVMGQSGSGVKRRKVRASVNDIFA